MFNKIDNNTESNITYSDNYIKIKNLKILSDDEEEDIDTGTDTDTNTNTEVNVLDNYTDEDIQALELELENEILHHNKTDLFFNKYDRYFNLQDKYNLNIKASEINFPCYREVIDHYESSCLDFSEYAIQYYKYFAITCSFDSNINVKQIITIINQLCS